MRAHGPTGHAYNGEQARTELQEALTIQELAAMAADAAGYHDGRDRLRGTSAAAYPGLDDVKYLADVMNGVWWRRQEMSR